MKKSFISVLMVIALLLSAIVSPLSTASAFGEDKKPEEVVLDFSFFDVDSVANYEKYTKGAEQFLRDTYTLISFLNGCDFSDVSIYNKCAAALKYQKISEYLSQDKYLNPLKNYVTKDDYGSKFDTKLEMILSFHYDFTGNFTNDAIKQLDDALNAASKLEKAKMQRAIELCNRVISICDSTLSNVPDLQAAKDEKVKAQEFMTKIMGSVDSKIFSSDVHKNNISKILFSKNNIPAGKETTGSFSTSFDANSNIYAIAYLSTPLQKIVPKASYYSNPNETCSATAYIKIDGVDFDYGSIKFSVDVQEYQTNNAYVTFELLPNAKNTKGDNLKEWYDFVFSKLKPGKHTIGIEIAINNTNVANGEFEIDWTNADLGKISKNVTNCIKISENYRADKAQVPGVFKVKNKQYKDKTLSDKNIKAIFMKEFTDAKSIMKFVNVGDITDGWSVQKDEYGYPVAKHSTMNTWYIYKSKDGFCYIVEFSLIRDYDYDSETYGKPYVYTVSKTKIAAKNVK